MHKLAALMGLVVSAASSACWTCFSFFFRVVSSSQGLGLVGGDFDQEVTVE